MTTVWMDDTAGETQPGRKWGYAAVAVVVLVAALAAVGWRWRSGVTLTTIEVVSACETEWRFFSSTSCPPMNSTVEEVTELIGAEPGVPLYEMDPAEIVKQVGRHPWVRHVEVERTPSGRLTLTITERTPVLLAMRSGRPVHYIDAEGFRMPAVAGVAYDVPLLHGLSEPYDPEKPVSNPAVLELAAVLDDLDPSTQALLSEIEIRENSQITFHTTVLDSRGSIEVRLGAGGIREQLTKLHAFWHQVLLPEPGRDIRQIDLRFDSQIVTR